MRDTGSKNVIAANSSRDIRPDPREFALGTAKAGFLVDRDLKVFRVLGDAGAYVKTARTHEHSSLYRLLHPELRRPLLAALREARTQPGPIRKERIALPATGGTQVVNLTLSRFDHPSFEQPAMHVLIEQALPAPAVESVLNHAITSAGVPDRQPSSAPLKLLKADLEISRASLEALVVRQATGAARLRESYRQLKTLTSEGEAARQELTAAHAEILALNHQLRLVIERLDRARKDRLLLEEAVLNSQRLESLQIMARGVAHDFNNLLTSIIGNASFLQEELGHSEMGDAAQQIEKAGDHASALVKQLLSVCGQGTSSAQFLDLSSLVRDSIELLRAAVPKTIEIRFQLADDLCLIHADATQIRQVLLNLVINGSEAIGSAPGTISITTRISAPNAYGNRSACSRTISLEVSDTGPGMSADVKSKVFDTFFSTKTAGRGMGLAVVQQIVRRHRGSIEVESSYDQGVCMRIFFPGAEGGTAITNAETSLGSGGLLVISDAWPVRRFVRCVLSRSDLHVMTAATRSSGLEIFRRHMRWIRVVLLDVDPHRADCGTALRQLRSISPSVPIIVSSSGSDDEHAPELALHGPTLALEKPYAAPELLAEVRKALTLDLSVSRVN